MLVNIDEYVQKTFGEESEPLFIRLLERHGVLASFFSSGIDDEDVRLYIIDRLAEIGSKEAIPVLERHAKSPVKSVSLASKRSIDCIKAKTQKEQ